MTKNLIAVSMMACLLASCSSEHCSKGDGCLNEKVVAYLNDKCRTGASENCRLSFKEAVGDFDRVYFVGTLGARLDQCKIIAAKDSLKRDRKSTRLNSSHVRISYAVFCLKKKNRIHNIL